MTNLTASSIGTYGVICFVLLLIPFIAWAFERGIYISQSTLQNTERLKYLVRKAKSVGINTFVVDIKYKSKRYASNIRYIQEQGLRYVARLVVFPGGGSVHQVRSKYIWLKRWRLAQYAIRHGADAVQLDYIRYSTARAASKRNIRDIRKVIEFFHNKLQGTGVELQIDVFGFTTMRPGYGIGQYPKAFADVIDSISPMVYPSHYKPYGYHSRRPYETVYSSLEALKEQLSRAPQVAIVPFIEIWNHRYPMSDRQQIRYFLKQVQAVRDSGVDGWYVWNARNNYRLLFEALD